MSSALDLGSTAVLSGVFAAAVAIAVTRAVERFGGLVGGVLATLPTTIIPASIGLVARLSSDQMTASMFTVPVGMLVSSLFLFQWRFWPPRLPSAWSFRRRLVTMLALSLSVWVAMAAAAVLVETQLLRTTQAIVVFGVSCYVVLGVAGVAACFRPLEAPGGSKAVSWRMLAARGAMAGVAIAITVALSAVGGVVSGIASAFPAIFTTVMVGLWLAQGEGVPAGAAGPMMLGGLSPPSYAMIFALIQPTVGTPGSVIISWILAVGCVSVPAALFLRWRRNVSAGIHPPGPVVQEKAGAATEPEGEDDENDEADTAVLVVSAAPGAGEGQEGLVVGGAAAETPWSDGGRRPPSPPHQAPASS
jgi:hypothetical protein